MSLARVQECVLIGAQFGADGAIFLNPASDAKDESKDGEDETDGTIGAGLRWVPLSWCG